MLRYTRTRHSLDLHPTVYWPDRVMAANINTGANPALVSSAWVYNNGSFGEDLTLWQFNVIPTAAMQMGFIVAKGFQGAISSEIGPWYALAQSRAGQLYGTGSSNLPSVPGVNFFAAVTGYTWPYNYPVATVPAGYSVVIFGSIVNTGFLCSVLWLVEPTPGKGE